MALYSEYEEYVKKHVKEFGQRTVVLYRCGGFYEIYSADDGLVDMKVICDLLNIQMSRRNKSILQVDRVNTLMAGFPAHALQKFVNILVSENYTVVVVDQVTEPPKPKRAVTAIISPGTDIQNPVVYESNNLMCICIEETRDFKTKEIIYGVGISVIDLTVGVSKVFETYNFALDEAFRLVQAENPREIVLMGDELKGAEDSIIKYLELEGRCFHNKLGACGAAGKISYQNELLEKVFNGRTGMLSVIEYLDMEKMSLALTSYVFLLQFSFQHNENILTKIQKPTILNTSDKLVLAYNCIKHLDIEGLLRILNRCVTTMGRRYFKECFMNPLTCPIAIQKRYDAVELALHEYKQVTKTLEKIYDVERITRKILLGTVQPGEFIMLHKSLAAYSEIDSSITSSLSVIKAKLDLDAIDSGAEFIFNKGLFSRLDQIQGDLDVQTGFFNKLVNDLNAAIKATDYFKLESNQDGYYLTITVKRYNDCKSKLADFKSDEFRFIDVEKKLAAGGTNYKLYHACFSKVQNRIERYKTKLTLGIKEEYSFFIEEFGSLYKDQLYHMINQVKELDFNVTNAKNAIDYKYFRPSLACGGSSSAFIKGTDLRHPIIERLYTRVPYVPNDVQINGDGLLLYGTNMVGKSAYMKSIGLCIIMAQCGMYVPCLNMEYSPFKAIYTRIPSGDDLFKGQSTFAVEIMELRNILKRADAYSLVIGDELASGTESVSAVAIVGAGVVKLIELGAGFVFATHLHDLTKLERIRGLANLKIKHMAVEYDEVSKKLVYDRKLKEGQGSTLYGLEVCRALDMSLEFMTCANVFRYELLNIEADILKDRPSKYNKAHYIDTCSICGAPAEEVHHIRQQKEADIDGFIGVMHKNVRHNLTNVCEACHDKIHAGEIHVEGYKMTSAGRELVASPAAPGASQVAPAAPDYVSIILDKRRREKLSIAKIQKHLKECGHILSTYKINKILSTNK
jgi:DNA mismatch repair protein MutS